MHFRHVIVAMTFMACGGGGAMAHGASDRIVVDAGAIEAARHDLAPGRDAPDGADGPDVPYNHAVQKSIHNAYERDEPILDQLVYHRVRSLELDIHTRREGTSAPPRDWFVYHEDNPVMRNTTCSQLSDCLGQMAAFHRAVPQHEVVTIFIDLKEGFENGHGWSDLDGALAKGLGRDNVLTPADLMAGCPGASSLREAVTGSCAFPSLRALRGKFIVVTTGGGSCDAASPVARYGGDNPNARLAFVGPDVDAGCPVASYDAKPHVIFFNMSFDERARAAEVQSRGLVTRVYHGGVPGGLDSASDFESARAAGATHIATDKASYEADEWAATHGPRGFPFTCEGCGDDLIEPGTMLGVRATSGDQWGTADSGFFAYETDMADASVSALVSVPSSHVQPFAKACLVARASDAADAANVSVCRTFDANPPRAQVRTSAGAPTTSTDAPTFDGITPEAPAFLRLDVKSVYGGSEVTAAVSRDGKIWSTFSRQTLPMRLPMRGVSVSSHGTAKVKGLFANLAKSQNGTTTTMTAAALHQKAIGPGTRGDAFDSVFAPMFGRLVAR